MFKPVRLLMAVLALALPAAAQSANDLNAPAQRWPGRVATIVVPVVTVNGVLGSGSGGSCEGTGIAPARPTRNGVPSTCAAPKGYPGTFSAGAYYYDTYQLMNATASTQCVDMTITSNDAGSGVHLWIYNGTFDPNALATNYLADTGSSSGGGTTQGLSLSVAAGQTVVVVVENSGSGVTGTPYTFTYDYLSLGCTAFDLYFEDDALRSRMWLSSTTGAWTYDVLVGSAGPWGAGPAMGSYKGTTAPVVSGGVILLPATNAAGQSVSGFYDPTSRRANFTLRTADNRKSNLSDTNTTGALPGPVLAH